MTISVRRKMSKFDVCVFGSAMIDFISYVNRMPLAGETLPSKSFEIGFGGKGCNQAIAAARMSCKTAMIGNIGNDPYGKSYKEYFDKEGVNTKYFECVGEYTGIALIVVDESGNNQIVINANANQNLSKQDVVRVNDILKDSKILITQLEVPLEATIEALQCFKGFSILNAAPALDNLPEKIYGLADIFCVNELEAEALTKIHFEEIKDAKEMVVILQKRGCKTVIITLGKLGVVYNDESDGKIIYVPLPKKIQQINAIDSTGAGDAFIGGLAYFISKFPKATILQKIGASILVASHSVQFKGTQTSYRDFPEIDPTTENFEFIEM